MIAGIMIVGSPIKKKIKLIKLNHDGRECIYIILKRSSFPIADCNVLAQFSVNFQKYEGA